MKRYFLTFKSKNKNSLNHFWSNILQDEKFLSSYKTIQKNFKNANTQKKFSILTSPHVNKSAQEQFEFRYFQKKIMINSISDLKFKKLIKHLKSQLFTDISVKVLFFLKKKDEYTLQMKLLNPTNFKVNSLQLVGGNLDNFFKKNKHQLVKVTITYLKIWDSYGESVKRNYT